MGTDGELSGRLALVTGGSRGLGKAIVSALAFAGADVIIVSRKREACQAVAALVETTTGVTAYALSCHVGHWNEIDDLVSTVYERFGRLDILVNNAGMSPLYPTPSAVGEDLFDKVIGVNLKGPFRLTALVGERMAAGHGGSIINISSGAAVRPGPGILPYAAAKAGLNALTVGFAHALGPNVRVNCVMAGPFSTEATSDWTGTEFENAADRLALRRMGRPDEITGAVLYFAGPASSFTTGAILPVDGGLP